jgi:hypothetical protein
MNKFLLGARYLAGVIVFAMSIWQFTEKGNPLMYSGFALIAALLFLPPTIKVRGHKGFLSHQLPIKQFFFSYTLLAALRWYIGMFYSLGGIATIDSKDYVEGMMMLSLGIILITPLDRFFFPGLFIPKADRPRRQAIAALMTRNSGAMLWGLAPAIYSGNGYAEGIGMFILGAGWLLASGRITPRDLVVPIPEHIIKQEVNLVVPVYEVSARATVIAPPGEQLITKLIKFLKSTTISLPQPAARRPRKGKYYDAFVMQWTITPSRINATYFNSLIKDYQRNWLEANDYRQKLSLHRDPEEFNAQTVTKLIYYINEIRDRAALKYATSIESVPDQITDVWKSDKRVRSLFRAMELYSWKKGSKPVWKIIAHIAEYRAMINLVKWIKRPGIKVPREKIQSSLRIVPAESIDAEMTAALMRMSPSLPALGSNGRTIWNDDTYFQIIDYIVLLGKNLENYKDLSDKFNEERYRDYFLPFLNAVSPHYSAKGEVFNRLGKTDILVCDSEGNNLFIAECKLWRGEAYLRNGVDQLLNSYVNWRDEKTAIVIFNRDVKQFSQVEFTATGAMAQHPLCLQALGKRSDASWSYLFRHPDDEHRIIRIELVLFNFV